MHGVVPKSMWQRANPADDNNMCSWAMRCLLLDHGNYRILVDTGMGDKQDDKFFSFYYPHGEDSLVGNLARCGYTPEDITDVFLTHLHFDHCGGAIIRNEAGDLVPAFPKALYWTHEAHWHSATNPNEREKASFLQENILPIEASGQRRFVETANSSSWIQDIEVLVVNGHTDSMMLPQIQFNGRTILFCADLIPSAAHVSMPWVMAYDMRPVDTLREKRKVLFEAAANDWVLFFEHDPKIECATVQEVDGRVKIKETFRLDELMTS